ncbi:hypothetical protein BCR35DRAFT_316387 [Leucosporidium creatinivorum]|uniref:F-box domain-containing protein n=1 Tax=Leucosporidium creatinivorum TaxID=106004 RepID=A0A1Y2CC75_9BASI|nr:hypothetical protein BCR35DRAFT_316387 [Leucosporidium creatinivorum]
MPHLQTWRGEPTLETLHALLESTRPLHRLKITFRDEYEPMAPPLLSLPSSPPPLFALYVKTEQPDVVLALVRAVGATLQHLSIYFEHPLPPETTLSSLRTTTSSLRRLSLHLNLSSQWAQDRIVFKELLPEFTVLEKLVFSTDLVATADVVWKAPPSLRWMEIVAYDEAGTIVKDIIDYIPFITTPLHLRQLIIRCEEPDVEELVDVLPGAIAALRSKGTAFLVSFDSETPAHEFFGSL